MNLIWLTYFNIKKEYGNNNSITPHQYSRGEALLHLYKPKQSTKKQVSFMYFYIILVDQTK
jgi:hypothetical protein